MVAVKIFILFSAFPIYQHAKKLRCAPVKDSAAGSGVDIGVEGRDDRVFEREGHVVEGGDFSQKRHQSIDANLKAFPLIKS